MTRYALRCSGGVDSIALSHLDEFFLIPSVDCYTSPSRYISEIDGPSMDKTLSYTALFRPGHG